MSEPIKIVVVAQTEEAAKKLKDFVQQEGSAVAASMEKSAKATDNLTKSAFKARMGLLELEHVGRSSVDIMLMGGNSRMLLAQIPQLLQSLSLMGVSLSAMAPYILAAGAAVGVLATEWYAVMGNVEDTTKKTEELVKKLDEIPSILERIQRLTGAGLLSRAAGTEFADYLNGRKPLYVTPEGDVTTSPTHMGVVRTGTRTSGMAPLVPVPNAAATQAQINDYVSKQLPQVAAAQEKAAEHLKELMEKARVESLDGIEKEKAQIHDRYEKERQEIRLTAEQAGHLIGPKTYDAATNAAIKNLDAAEASAKLTAEKKAQEESDRKTEELQQAINSYVETELSLEKEITAEEERQRSLREEILRGRIQAHIESIQGNPLLGDLQKAKELLPLQQKLVDLDATRIDRLQDLANDPATDPTAKLLAEQQMVELMRDQARIRNEMSAEQGETSFTYQLGLAVAHLHDMNNLAKEVAQTFTTVFNSSIADVSNGITGLIMGTMTWRQFLAEIPRQILTEIVGAIVQMGVRWVATEIMMTVMGSALQKAALAAAAPTAIAAAGLWAPAAVSASIATGGAAAVSGLSAFKMAEIAAAAIPGFAEGGFTGGREGHFAGVVHGGEYVFSAPAVQRIGVGNLDAMHLDARNRNSSLPAWEREHKTEVIFVNNRSDLLEHLKSSEAQRIIVGIVEANRMRLGIQT